MSSGDARVHEYRLFPLGTVLFPGGPLPLRVFEPRYVDLVSHCLRNDEPFGVCLIQSGQEVGDAATPFAVGTLAKIVDWHQYDDGVLGIRAVGQRRIRVVSSTTQADQLVVAQCSLIDEPEDATPADAGSLLELLERILPQAGEHYAQMEPRREDAAWVGYRLSELLPLPLTRRQHLLELDDPCARLTELQRVVRALELAKEMHEARVRDTEPDA